MSNKDWYVDWFNSHFYHQLYINRDDTEAERFIKNITEYLALPKTSHILDIACGRGRHSISFNNLGFSVTGIDISEESIAYANQYANDHLHFYVHDMRLPFWMNYFDVAVNLFTSFGYFRTVREDDAAIRTIAKSIKPGGLFVFDYLNVTNASKKLQAESYKLINGTKFYIKRHQTDAHFYKEIKVVHPSLETPLFHTEKVAKFTLSDFERMFEKQGLTITQKFGNYNLDEFNEEESPRLILIAKK
ncbi:MAG: class I SAM-dependent methyltransferase [Chitinophagaceae bacterium]|nr:MAG: class I SAM-dependent methyltransferase [Chitinophagaceae bacterium]